MDQNIFSSYHLVLMDTVLPAGLAIFNRVQKGHAGKIIDDLRSSTSPIQMLQEEGSEVAQLVRDRLDQIVPGLGNPILEVKVSINSNKNNHVESISENDLVNILNRIESRLNLLKLYIDNSFIKN